MAAKKIKQKHNNSSLFLIGVLVAVVFAVGIFFGKNISMSLPSNAMPTPIPVDTMVTRDPVFKETYEGTLPCADCSGLQTSLMLSRDEAYQAFGTYELQETYEGKSSEPYITRGKWTMLHGTPSNPDANVYELHSKDGEESEYYLILNNKQVILLDNNLHEIDSPFNYTLTKQQNSQLANPASVNCVDQGGVSEIRKDATGNEYGMCKMADGRECEEWVLFREDKCVAK